MTWFVYWICHPGERGIAGFSMGQAWTDPVPEKGGCPVSHNGATYMFSYLNVYMSTGYAYVWGRLYI